ncbi:VOC family protein [Virgibacillus sp. LDC-1]|uniref:VOC family protein n=1 Tax=Virgibacillus sp. LDC-1 TaxID=3039856 RepID=UPI0024DE92ED|nr:VOC family protein [Virgibacillus sp. LDC-1]
MLALDHIVFAGTNAQEASANYGRRFSFKAVKGGEHESWGTYNFLAYFSNDSYLEWLGISNYEKAKHSDNPLIKHLVYVIDQQQPGPFQFALRTDQLDSYIEHFHKHNIPFHGPFHGKRRRSDGTVLSWRMLFPEYNYKEQVLPFLIEWESSNDVSSLFNPQAITRIKYGGMDKDTFGHIYQLKPRKLIKNQLSLQNSKITFTDNEMLSFELE